MVNDYIYRSTNLWMKMNAFMLGRNMRLRKRGKKGSDLLEEWIWAMIMTKLREIQVFFHFFSIPKSEIWKKSLIQFFLESDSSHSANEDDFFAKFPFETKGKKKTQKKKGKKYIFKRFHFNKSYCCPQIAFSFFRFQLQRRKSKTRNLRLIQDFPHVNIFIINIVWILDDNRIFYFFQLAPAKTMKFENGMPSSMNQHASGDFFTSELAPHLWK